MSACDAQPCIEHVIAYLGIEHDTLLSAQQASVCRIFRLDTQMATLHLATAQTCTGVILAEDACTAARRATLDGLQAIGNMCTSGCEDITTKVIWVEECIENELDRLSREGAGTTLSGRLGLAACVEHAVGDCSALRLPIARILQSSEFGSPTLPLFSNHTWYELEHLEPGELGITLALATEPEFDNGCFVDAMEVHYQCLTDVYGYIDTDPNQQIETIGDYCGMLMPGVIHFKAAVECLGDVYSADACSHRMTALGRRLRAYVMICRDKACNDMREEVSGISQCLLPIAELPLPVDRKSLARLVDDVVPCVHEAVGGCSVLRTYINSLLAGQPRQDIHPHADRTWSILLKALGENMEPHLRSLEGYMAKPQPGCGVDSHDALACLTDFENSLRIYAADVQKEMCKLLEPTSRDLEWALICLQTRGIERRCNDTMGIYIQLCQHEDCNHVIAKVIEVNRCLSGLHDVALKGGHIQCAEVSNRTSCIDRARGSCPVLGDVIQLTTQGDGGDLYRVFTSDPWDITLPMLKGVNCIVPTVTRGSVQKERHFSAFEPSKGARHLLHTSCLYATIGAVSLFLT